jgi:TonB-dependent receptor
MKSNLLKLTFTFFLLVFTQAFYAQQNIKGQVRDANNNDPLTGATVSIEGTKKGTIVDVDGNFEFSSIAPGKYVLSVSYVSYKPLKLEVVVKKDEPTVVEIKLEEASLALGGVTVIGQKKTDTELSMLKSVRTSIQVVNGISSQQIGKTLDRDASEVVKRVPGVTIQDNRFIVVRGLNQRYNNVWLNNAATPSSETDVKAFSFDAIPSNMIDNLMVFKTGAPELSGEATGGFIKIFTKNIPEEKFLNVEYGTAYNDQTTFRPTYRLPSNDPLDYIGFGAGSRSLPANFSTSRLDENTLAQIKTRDANALLLSNKWFPEKHIALPNQKFTLTFGNKWRLANESKLGTITSIFYNNSYNTRNSMINKSYEGVGNIGEPNYNFDYKANLYSNEVRIGAMHNWAYLMSNGNKIEFKNTFNQIATDRSTTTEGFNNNRNSNFRFINNQYSSRTTYSGQINGFHKLSEEKEAKLDWNLGYAYANRLEPDRQNMNYRLDADNNWIYQIPSTASINELGRLYLKNHENVYTLAVNYEQALKISRIKSTIKSGCYVEDKSREFSERSLTYVKNNNYLSFDSIVSNVPFESLFTQPYMGLDKVLNMSEQTSKTNSYGALSRLYAGYLALNLPYGDFNVYAGVRVENYTLKLNGYFDETNKIKMDTTSLNFFPSLNANYNINKNSLIRIAYASTVNRPEFREISTFSYYDFNERYSVRGNPKLIDAKIQNIDIRFENYPSPTETFSIAAFYKGFVNPIEMVSVGSGNSFSFQNAKKATNYGLELETKRSLETLLGLKNFSFGLNASYIFSLVDFGDSKSERARPLQGQSPYVINTSLFYQNDKAGISSSIMYNVMGRRILVAARLNQGEVQDPDIFEMPRNVIDFNFSKKFGKYTELKFGIKDILSQDFVTQQTFEYTATDGSKQTSTLINRRFNLGRTFSLGLVIKL